jgi:hypothetical protein
VPEWRAGTPVPDVLGDVDGQCMEEPWSIGPITPGSCTLLRSL